MPTLGRRVAAAAIASALAAGGAAASVAAFAVDQVVSENTDRRLIGAALVLAGELREEEVEQEGETLDQIARDENAELGPTGIRLSIVRRDQIIAGEATTPTIRAGRCESIGVLGERTRACAQRHRDLTLIAAQRSDRDDTRWLYVAAGLAALAIGATVGVAAGGILARWAMNPLSDLTSAIGRMAPKASSHDLGPPSRCAEVAAIQTAIMELLTRLNRELDRTRRFAADAAHELRTPLTKLRAEIELLLEQAPGADEAALERIGRRTEQLVSLVDRLLVLAAPLDEAALGFETVALHDVIESVVTGLPREQASRVHLELVSEGLVRGDTTLLASLVNNALDNALKFSGSTPVRLTLCETVQAVRLEVEDQGRGISPEERDLVFEPFYRVRTCPPQPGRGLGLALIAHIAKAHGGSARFVDRTIGACLQVDLPPWRPEPRII